MDELRFDGRVVIITGAGRGLGRAYAVLLASRGAAVVVNDADVGGTPSQSGAGHPADDCVAAIRSAGGTASASHESVARSGGATAIVAQALHEFGRVDALVNNAGIAMDKPFSDTTEQELRSVMDVHFMGTALMCRAALDPMRAARFGRIVNTTSSGIFGYANCSAYAAAKGAILAFTRSLALEAGPMNVGVNCIAPAAATRMTAGVGMDPAQRSWMERALPAAAVAPAVAFLAHESCTLQGETLSAAGGAVRRYLLGENAGYKTAALTPEAIAQNLAAILDTDSFRAFGNTNEAVARATALQDAADS